MTTHKPRVLFVFTSASQLLGGTPTGWFLPEAAQPYYTLYDHADIDFASPKGPNPPLDQGSVQLFKEDAESVRFLTDTIAQAKLASAKKLDQIDFKDYDAVFYIGGHGPVIDLASDPVNAKLVENFWNSDKIVSAVCHGQAGLVGAKDASGKWLFEGKNLTALSRSEEEQEGKIPQLPFVLEDKLRELGANYSKADKNWGEKVIVDGRLITGQNPWSARAVAVELIKSLGIKQ